MPKGISPCIPAPVRPPSPALGLTARRLDTVQIPRFSPDDGDYPGFSFALKNSNDQAALGIEVMLPIENSALTISDGAFVLCLQFAVVE